MRETKEGKASGQCLGIIQLAQSLVTLKPHGAGVIAEEFDSKVGLVFKLFDVKAIRFCECPPVDVPDVVARRVEFMLTELDGGASAGRAMEASE